MMAHEESWLGAALLEFNKIVYHGWKSLPWLESCHVVVPRSIVKA